MKYIILCGAVIFALLYRVTFHDSDLVLGAVPFPDQGITVLYLVLNCLILLQNSPIGRRV